MDTPTFILGDTEFGIDAAKSSCSVEEFDGRIWLSFEVHGDQSTYDRISSDEHSLWSWTLYPPRFYGDFPASRDDAGIVEARVKIDDLQEYQVALYLMNHNDVEVIVRLYPDGHAEAEGVADIMGKQTRFRIRWNGNSCGSGN